MATKLDHKKALQAIEKSFYHSDPASAQPLPSIDNSSDLLSAPGDGILKYLFDYVAVPNQSPQFDAQCLTNGLQEKAVAVLLQWIQIKQKQVKSMKYTILAEENRTPAIFIEIEPFGGKNEESKSLENTILMYGHLDKQPPLLPWNKGLHPHKPVLRQGKLYGNAQ
jgi:acetylornithine deacetylase/succinyl-diaminopimelate desuccinylase-like protein